MSCKHQHAVPLSLVLRREKLVLTGSSLSAVGKSIRQLLNDFLVCILAPLLHAENKMFEHHVKPVFCIILLF